MKRIIVVVSVIFLLTSAIFVYQTLFRAQDVAADDKDMSTQKSDIILAQELKKSTRTNNSWLAKVDDTTITIKDFEKEFQVHIYALPIDDIQKKKYQQDNNNSNRSPSQKLLANTVRLFLNSLFS